MRGWRKKVLVILVIYFAGFGTAIYTLAPVEAEAAGAESSQRGGVEDGEADVNPDEIVAKIKSGMQEFIGFAEDKASKVGSMIKVALKTSQDE